MYCDEGSYRYKPNEVIFIIEGSGEGCEDGARENSIDQTIQKPISDSLSLNRGSWEFDPDLQFQETIEYKANIKYLKFPLLKQSFRHNSVGELIREKKNHFEPAKFPQRKKVVNGVLNNIIKIPLNLPGAFRSTKVQTPENQFFEDILRYNAYFEKIPRQKLILLKFSIG